MVLMTEIWTDNHLYIYVVDNLYLLSGSVLACNVSTLCSARHEDVKLKLEIRHPSLYLLFLQFSVQSNNLSVVFALIIP